jgi:hypothetical protein
VKRKSGKIEKGVDDHHLRQEPARLPSASSLARRLLPLPAIGFWRCAGGKGKLRLVKVWRQKAWWKIGGTYGFIYRDGKEIVALDRGAYPEKVRKWRGFLNRIAVGSFGNQAESYSVDWLGWVVVGVLFGYGTVWPRLLNGSSKNCEQIDKEKRQGYKYD